jgi:hypothetical protein
MRPDAASKHAISRHSAPVRLKNMRSVDALIAQELPLIDRPLREAALLVTAIIEGTEQLNIVPS